MRDRKQELIEVFQDTQKFYTENEQLAAAVMASKKGTQLYEADDFPSLPEKRKTPVQIRVSKDTSFMAANQRYFYHGREHIAVLNFASAVNPGGGVKRGSSAQEESLCRCSTLFPTLNQQFLWDRYYNVNRAAQDPLHTDACIWSPGIVICKLDTSIPIRISAPEGWATVDVISCAAPNLREKTWNLNNPEDATSVKLTSEEQYTLHLKRAKHILHIAASKRVAVLILGAFGCGAFANDPWAVARAYKDSLDEYGQYFKYIEFAVYCRDYETENYDAFRKTFS
ncbi:MAG: TIGR02452 family protein [Clostridia bacterium]|nr:TIGR02452 family protein [Clostridia bacterium]